MKKSYQDRYYHIRSKRLFLGLENHTDLLVPSKLAFARWIFETAQQAYSRVNIGLLLCGADEARGYNQRYRKKNYATNVLSFRLDNGENLGCLSGDLVICSPVVEKEAKEYGKELMAHYAHLTVHGVLHLMGHDHETDADAVVMEKKEAIVLQGMGYTNPYLDNNME